MDEKQQAIIAEIHRVATLLNVETLSIKQFSKHGKVDAKTVKDRFGSWNRAIEAAGLKPNLQATITDDELLLEIIRLTLKVGKEPSGNELAAFGKYSLDRYRTRWGNFSTAKEAAYSKYGFPDIGNQANTVVSKKTIKKAQYGEPIDFRGLRHAPINEQGVVYLFGIVSRELGFLIESVRTGYPDCEGKRCVDEKRQIWERVLIEFEFKSSNFRTHGHDPDDCDVIVCWIHDWVDCPEDLEVIELSIAINSLSK